jgi:hypothetical protein
MLDGSFSRKGGGPALKTEIELARERRQRAAQLAAGARIARERYQFYKAQVYGPQMASLERLRQLKRNAELADRRLRSTRGAPALRRYPGGGVAA